MKNKFCVIGDIFQIDTGRASEALHRKWLSTRQVQ